MSDSLAPPAPRVLVTRPEAEALRWVAGLQAAGLDAHALPLITIAPPVDVEPVRQAGQRLADYAAVMFVSSNSVHYFWAQQPAEVVQAWAQGRLATRAWSPGPGTSRALMQAGLAATQIDAPADEAPQFDSEALWARVQAQVRPGQRVLIVRGSDENGQGAGRDWLPEQLRAAGVQVDQLSAYRRVPPQLPAPALALVQHAASDGSIWLFSSSEAIANLQAQLPGQDWSAARAVATHPRIAATARRAGWGVVCESRPALSAVVASIKSCE